MRAARLALAALAAAVLAACGTGLPTAPDARDGGRRTDSIGMLGSGAAIPPAPTDPDPTTGAAL